MPKKDLTKPLTVTEQKHLTNHIAAVDAGLETFLIVGNALSHIDEEQLFRQWPNPKTGEVCKSFREFVDVKWQKTRAWAYDQIAAARSVQDIRQVSTMVDILPASERQARPLAKLDNPKQKAEAWDSAVKVAEEANRPVTAADVEKEVSQWFPDPEHADKPPVDVGEPVEESPPPLLDAMENPVPDDAREVFEDREEGREILSDLRKVDGRIKRWAETLGGFWCSHKAAVVRLRETKAAIAAALPHSICTDCRGDECNACMGHRFLLKSQLDIEGISSNQEKLLQKRKIETEEMSKKEASRLIDDIAREEGWKPREQNGG